MSLMPNLNPKYFTQGDRSLKQLIDYSYQRNSMMNLNFWGEADTDTRFAAGDQNVYNSFYGNYYPQNRKREFYFNKLRTFTNRVVGHQAQHRKSWVYSPVEQSDQKTADQFTKVALHCQTNDNMLYTITEGFSRTVTCGMSLFSLWLDYSKDPVNGELRLSNHPYNSYQIDPFFKNKDLTDCNNIYTRRYISRAQACAIFPSRMNEIKTMTNWGGKDGRFQFMAENYNFSGLDLLTYDEFWYLDYREATFLTDFSNGETREWKGSEESLELFLKWAGPKVAVYQQTIPTVKLGIVLNGIEMYNGENPLGLDTYPHVASLCYFYPELRDANRMQGIIRGLRDSQFIFNRKMNIQLSILEAQPSSGYIFKENALVNPADVFLQGPGRSIPVKAEANITDITPIPPPRLDQSMMALTAQLSEEMKEICGMSDELLGLENGDASGFLSALRQGASLITLQPIFDNLDLTIKLIGEKTAQIIQKNWTPGKVARILGEEPSEQFYNGTFHSYNCVVQEGLNTPTQRQMEAAQLVALKKEGAPIPWSLILETGTIQKKGDLIENIQKEEEGAAKMQQEQLQAQIALVKAQISDLEGKTKANIGLGVERISRIEENRALAIERQAAAEKDRAQKDLDYVKSVKELTTVDLNHLLQSAQILEALRPASLIDKEAEKQTAPDLVEKNPLQNMESMGYTPEMSPSGEMSQEGSIPSTRS